MRYLVTGADGFIGSHLVEALLARSDTEWVVAHAHRAITRWLPARTGGRLNVISGDIARSLSLAKVGRVDAILHLAAMSSMAMCERHPDKARLTNFQGTVNALNLAIEQEPPPRFVFVSSAALYGEPQYLPIDEAHPVEIRDQYTSTKRATEITVESYNKQQGLPTVIVRPFNVYGPRQGPDFVVPTIINQCLQGIELRLGDGRPVRNFTYVTDAADLLVRAAIAPGAVGRMINLGTRGTISIANLAGMVVDLTGCGLEPIFDIARFREGDPTIHEMDPSLAESLLGWRPHVLLLEGLERTIDHHREGHADAQRRLARELYGGA